MKPDIQIINPITYPNWDNLILSHPDYFFFHSSVWAKVLNEAYRYEPLYFTIFKNGGISSLIPFMEVNSFFSGRRAVSLPFSDYCEPLSNKETQFNHELSHIVEVGKKREWNFLELRGGANNLNDAIPCSSYFGHVLHFLPNEDQIFSSFKGNTRRNIKKAIREGVQVEISNCMESLREFYRLNSMTRKRHGLPPQPRLFFKKIYNYIISNNFGFIALARFHGETIAGTIIFHFGEKAIFKFGASDIRYQHLRANNLIMWEAIKWCRKNGYRSFYFGRTEPENMGLRRYKKGWGTEEYTIDYYKYDLTKDTFVTDSQKISAFQKKIISKIPIPLLKIVGSLLSRHTA